MSSKRMMIIACVAFISVVLTASVALWILSTGNGSMDYWATHRDFNSVAKNGSNEIVFEMPFVGGYPDSEVSFTDCAVSLEINGTSLPPFNAFLVNYMDLGGHYWVAHAQYVKGAGESNSMTFHQGNLSYTVTFIDNDGNGRVTSGDIVTLECTEPLTPETSYAMKVYVDIDGTWGIGTVHGVYQN